MTVERFNEIVETELNRVKNLLVKKQAEYNLDHSDRLEHFKDASAMSGLSPEQVLYGYKLKHLMSYKTMITATIKEGKKFPRELWVEKMGDLVSYDLLLLALLEDDNMFTEDSKKEA